jgi:hypothetical protein
MVWMEWMEGGKGREGWGGVKQDGVD